MLYVEHIIDADSLNEVHVDGLILKISLMHKILDESINNGDGF